MLSSQMGWFLFRVRAVAVALRILSLAAAALLAVWLRVGAITVAFRVWGFAITAHFGGWVILIRGIGHGCPEEP